MLYEVKKVELLPYCKYASKLLTQFDTFSIEHVPWKKNRLADALANLASTLAILNREIKVLICQRMFVSSALEVEDEDEVNIVSIYEIDKED